MARPLRYQPSNDFPEEMVMRAAHLTVWVVIARFLGWTSICR